MSQSYVISGTQGGPAIDGTSEVVLKADHAGNPTKVIGVDRPCELTKDDKNVLAELGIEIATSSAAGKAGQTQVGSDAAVAGPSISG